MRIKLFVCYLLVIGTVCSAGSSAQAQSNPEEVAPAPGLKYTPEQMWRRLMAIAEGPIPSRGELEKEFGFTFRYSGKELPVAQGGGTFYGAAASPPFGTPQQPQASNISYEVFRTSTLIAFHFDPKRFGINRTADRYCVENEYLFKALTGKWMRFKKEQGHYPVVINYTASFNGIERKVELSPLYLSADSSPCLQSFLIDYMRPTVGQQKGPHAYIAYEAIFPILSQRKDMSTVTAQKALDLI